MRGRNPFPAEVQGDKIYLHDMEEGALGDELDGRSIDIAGARRLKPAVQTGGGR